MYFDHMIRKHRINRYILHIDTNMNTHTRTDGAICLGEYCLSVSITVSRISENKVLGFSVRKILYEVNGYRKTHPKC